METQTEVYDYEVFDSKDYKGYGVIKWLRVYREDKSYYHTCKSIRYKGTKERAEQYKISKEVLKE